MTMTTMQIHALAAAPPPAALAEALERFERSFRYPLGNDGHFHVSHGRDYTRFFRAMGEPHVLVAERRGEVLGTLAGIPRRLPGSSGGEIGEAIYLCDCKIAPGAGRVLLALARTMVEAFSHRVQGRAYGVVMDGTPRLPSRYTGRCEIPGFEPLSAIRLFRFSTATASACDELPQEIPVDDLADRQRSWTAGSVVPLGGEPARRSEVPPSHLANADGTAVGILEDTRAGKRLIDGAGREMRNAHLSRFAFLTPAAGAQLIRQVLPQAREAGFEGLFVAVPESQASSLRQALGGLSAAEAPATVFGHRLPAGEPWEISTSEI